MVDLDTLWKGAVTTGVVGINFKFVYDGIKSYKAKKSNNGKYNGLEKRSSIRYVDTNDCITKHSQNDEAVSKKISEVHKRITEVGESISNVQGYLQGKFGE